MKNLTTLLLLFVSITTFSQEITGDELLEKAIKFHDPNNNWDTFKGKLFITMEIPKRANRDSEIHIDLAKEYFYVKAVRDSITTEYTLAKDQCEIAFNGVKNPSEAILKKHRLSEKRGVFMKNYYTYLYGLPMKLKDPGTVLNKKVIRKKFKGKEYLVLKATYKQEVGKDIWYFYFDPSTYAMEIYQFFHDEAKNDGEYILLTGEETINGVKMPKNRIWYTNKEDKLLGTDILSSKK